MKLFLTSKLCTNSTTECEQQLHGHEVRLDGVLEPGGCVPVISEVKQNADFPIDEVV